MLGQSTLFLVRLAVPQIVRPYLLFRFSRRRFEPRLLGSASSLLRAAFSASCTLSDRTVSAMVTSSLNPCRVVSRFIFKSSLSKFEGRSNCAGMCRTAWRRLLSSVRVCICVRSVVNSETGVGVAVFSWGPATGACALAAGGGGGGIMSEDVPLDPGIVNAAVVVGGRGLLIVVEIIEDVSAHVPPLRCPI